jgi:putative molybdopterin biosynthesis protein
LEQDQFLQVIDLETAHIRFADAVGNIEFQEEFVPIEKALHRVLTRPIIAPINVPGFDRSNFDGFAVVSSDTDEADEMNPRTLRVVSQKIFAGYQPSEPILPGTCAEIATGAIIPRGANAVLMVEYTERTIIPSNGTDVQVDGQSSNSSGDVTVYRSVAVGDGISYCGSDIALGETVMHAGRRLTNRETAVLASMGLAEVPVRKLPAVAIISTGDELQSPGTTPALGKIFDANSRMLADHVREMGAIPIELGIVPDEIEQLNSKIEYALSVADFVVLSGGTSKGQGDMCYRVVQKWTDPGIVVHGVALKPGKPVCLAVTKNKPVAVLPGFPASARFTFDEFIAPLIRHWTGAQSKSDSVKAELKSRVNSAPGRTEYIPVGLLKATQDQNEPPSDELTRANYIAIPLSRDSGSVSTYARADGYFRVESTREFVDANESIDVTPILPVEEFADLFVVGSHCVHVDHLLNQCEQLGIRTRYFHVGSTGGLLAARRGSCDIATLHLLDPETREYNLPFVDETMHLVKGYPRTQGFIFRIDDKRFQHSSVEAIIDTLATDKDLLMVNRSAGSGTRLLIDTLLKGKKPAGYHSCCTSHTAVVSAIAQGRADWGIAIEAAAKQNPAVGFFPIDDEQFDFLIPKSRLNRAPIQAFIKLLTQYRTVRQK